MRIISGKYRGFQIHAPKSIPARPTTDRSKESLFNILQNKLDFEGLKVLDLFSGTGNMAYEFASRGAASVLAVDLNYTAVKFIQSTFKTLDYPGGKAVKANALTFYKREEGPFDLIFADPPYALAGIAQLPTLLLNSALVKEGSWVIMEHGIQLKPDEEMRVDYRIYGQSAFSIYQKSATFDQTSES
ncbi:MAG: RsmD family RNA methyltransferase [Bacteroidota bacterium]|nr:RsmD family RNA methyltransferase [Bacteroidota bacterium]MDX5430485.1 RsmD family RNA methyltransferase [Bacteroidota bacterium]MDX5469246.1 RsmD family RNA methyltransferase [Bacteroidota bacterium]